MQPQNQPATSDRNLALSLYSDLKQEGEERGRRYIKWRIIRGIENSLVDRFVKKIRANVQTSFYAIHYFGTVLENIEDGSTYVNWTNLCSPWFDRLSDAKIWLEQQEAKRLDPDNVHRPNTKWVFKEFLWVDLKVVLGRQPLLGTGPLPEWLRNRGRGGHKMFCLDTFYDNLCLWRCIAVHQGAKPDRSTQAGWQRGFSTSCQFRTTRQKPLLTSLKMLKSISTKKGIFQTGWGFVFTNLSAKTMKFFGIFAGTRQLKLKTF